MAERAPAIGDFLYHRRDGLVRCGVVAFTHGGRLFVNSPVGRSIRFPDSRGEKPGEIETVEEYGAADVEFCCSAPGSASIDWSVKGVWKS
jgi:hypothetical protein